MEQVFNPRRFQKALDFRCMTVSSVADKIGVSRQVVSYYKHGNIRNPNPEHIRKIASILNMPLRFFYNSNNEVTDGKETMYFRSLLSTKPSYRSQQRIKVEFIEELYRFLNEYIEFPKLNIPASCSKDPKEAAMQLREYWGIGQQPIQNIINLVENNGILVSCISTDTDTIDAFSKKIRINNQEETFFIGYSDNKKSASRINFDIAHELGHICLHGWLSSDVELDREEFKEQEAEANEFASVFLLPENTFLNDIKEVPPTISNYTELKKRWKTSIQAMVVRAYVLGAITHDTYQKFFINLSKRGYRKNEPLDNEMIIEDPMLLAAATMMLLENNIFTATEFLDEFYKFSELPLNAIDIENLLRLPKGTLAFTRILKFDKLSLK